jgi:hypothetical protein
MKRLIVISFVLVCSMSLIAQSSEKSVSPFTVGAFGGLNIPDLTGGGGNPLSSNWSSRSGLAYGLTFNWNTGTHFAWRVDVLYSSEGGQHNGMQALTASSFNPLASTNTYYYANYNNASIMNYVEVPVMAKYSFPLSRSSKFYVDFGPYVGFLLNAKQKTSGSSPVYEDAAGTIPLTVNPETALPYSVSFDASTPITDQIHTVNFGLTGGIGFSQEVGFGSVFVDFRGAYGLTVVQKNSAADGSNHIGNLLLSLGYSIPL